MQWWLIMVPVLAAVVVVPGKSEKSDRLSARVVKIFTAAEIPERVIVTVSIANHSKDRKDLIAALGEGKSGATMLVKPIVAEWFQDEKCVERDVQIVQQTTSLPEGKSVELNLLLKRPQEDGSYRLVLAMEPLRGGGTLIAPAGFRCEANIDCKDKDITLQAPPEPAPAGAAAKPKGGQE